MGARKEVIMFEPGDIVAWRSRYEGGDLYMLVLSVRDGHTLVRAEVTYIDLTSGDFHRQEHYRNDTFEVVS